MTCPTGTGSGEIQVSLLRREQRVKRRCPTPPHPPRPSVGELEVEAEAGGFQESVCPD